MSMLRLDKFLADMGKGTRSELKRELKKGLVTVNGKTEKSPERKIDPETDQVAYRGEPVCYEKFFYYMLNKPPGFVSATEDRRERTVMELMKGASGKGLFPVGRLDKDTEGLLLITNDGELAHRLLHPGRHVDKVYMAELAGPVTEEMICLFAEGLDIGDDKPALPARLVVLENGPRARTEITICEGRYHQVKRMAEAVGSRVLSLKRLSMGPLKLDENLPAGHYRPLTQEERQELGTG